MLAIEKPIGTTIAINGSWGSGKSSAVNLLRTEINAHKNSSLNVVDFRCWWYRGEEAIALAFLQELNTALKPALGDKLKSAIPDLGRYILQAGPVIGTAVSLASTAGIGTLISGGAAFANRFFPEKNSLEKVFNTISKALEEQSCRFLVIIDDIDRLSPEEALGIFRLVKSVGRLPKVMYLLVFDRQLADAAVQQKFPSEGPHFLEKIIQASFELPAPSQTDLNDALLTGVHDVCGLPPEQNLVYFMNVFYDVVVPYLKTPRHVTRLINAISVTWPPIASEVNLGDFVGLETIRLYEPLLFSSIRRNRDVATGKKRIEKKNRDTARFVPFLDGITTERDTLHRILQRLFPALEDITYTGDFSRRWDEERRVCISKHFDTYFRMSLSDETISSAELSELIERADDETYVRERLRQALDQIRRNGKSMVPIVLDELTTRAQSIPRDKVQNFVCALFGVADEIRRPEDSERGLGIVNTFSRVRWLISRVTEDRFPLDEKTALYSKATEAARFGWLTDFVACILEQHQPRDGRAPDTSSWLVAEADVPTLKNRALRALREAANNKALLHGHDLMYNLYRWCEFDGDGVEAREWLSKLMEDDEALVILARSLTGESWSFGVGGFGSLGDRVSRRSVQAQIGKDFDLFDQSRFRTELNRVVAERQRPEDDIKTVETFLGAWTKNREGKDD